ncbi:MAG: Hpt domain-containing protein, partial [Schwartzia sp.]|nr:Hpt domain-containing protein [Schwartzia sp. (in: firmicutes)]
MDTNQYMEMFLEESREHLQSLNDGLLALENDPEEVSVVNDIFRNAHTIKGMSATMGFTKIAELTHDMENVFDLLRKEQMKVNDDIMDTLFKTVDSLEQMIESVGGGGPEDVVDITSFESKLSALASGKTDGGAAPAAEAAPAAAAATPAAPTIEYSDTDRDVIRQAADSGMRAFHITVTLSNSCVLKSARSYMVMNALDQLGEVVKSVPPAEDLEQEKFEQSFDVVVVTDAEPKTLEEALLAISEVESVVIVDATEEIKATAAESQPAASQAAPAAAAPAAAAPA